jgi:hypothetical protein
LYLNISKPRLAIQCAHVLLLLVLLLRLPLLRLRHCKLYTRVAHQALSVALGRMLLYHPAIEAVE